ncbi:hypothetical protein HY008_00545 [Candidatus Woesebacteria bacterium]|nr:hypothetical protein [Candidatus Woesebacteria bacterium]
MKSYGKFKKITTDRKAKIPFIIGLFRSLNSGDAGMNKIVKGELEERAKAYGLASIDELRTSILDLRSQLKQELTQEDWKGYFGRTEDFT